MLESAFENLCLKDNNSDNESDPEPNNITNDDNIITFQPHPEFNSDYIQGLIQNRGKGIVPDNLLFTAKSKLDSLNDNDFLATKIKSFFAK